jgi:hypothetical protein
MYLCIWVSKCLCIYGFWDQSSYAFMACGTRVPMCLWILGLECRCILCFRMEILCDVGMEGILYRLKEREPSILICVNTYRGLCI